MEKQVYFMLQCFGFVAILACVNSYNSLYRVYTKKLHGTLNTFTKYKSYQIHSKYSLATFFPFCLENKYKEASDLYYSFHDSNKKT